ncbi:DUF7691 family protein [Streptomyces aureoversilis]|uniref:DUF7691 domain-containing protein n=1 Tax=Streptomyces aureoversilis TaxID=67277 RepID=A0ABW0AB56_9ACTN
MSHNIWYSTADKADVLAFLGSNGNLSDDQQHRLAEMRTSAQARQDELVRQDIDWGLPVPEALDHLIAGHTDSNAEYAGNAYHAALQIIIDHNASDPGHLGTFSGPATFFSHVDEVMKSLGVPAELLPYDFLYPALPPAGFPYVPHSVDGYPAIGHMPLDKVKPAADAYRAVLDQLDPSTRYDIQELIEKLDDEHENWVYATEKLDWYTQDTLFFALT